MGEMMIMIHHERSAAAGPERRLGKELYLIPIPQPIHTLSPAKSAESWMNS